MRFLLTEDFWALDALSPAEWHLVFELPSTSAGEKFATSTKERLFPSPLSPDSAADEETLDEIEDWDDYVRPELEQLFSESRDVVRSDIDDVEVIDPSEFLSSEQLEELAETLPELRRVKVPIENTEHWYSTLNQARLLMNEEFDLAQSEERLLAQLDASADIDDDRILLIAQYELYSAVQILLVENVMDR